MDDEGWHEGFLWKVLFGKNQRMVLKDIAGKAREEIREFYRQEETVKKEN